MEIEAGTSVCACNSLGAGAVGEELFEQTEGAADTSRASERPEVARTVFVHAARDIDLREVLRDINLDEWVALVVLETRIIRWLVLLDEVAFEDESFRLGFGYDVFVVGDPGDHVGNFAGQIGAGSEV